MYVINYKVINLYKKLLYAYFSLTSSQVSNAHFSSGLISNNLFKSASDSSYCFIMQYVSARYLNANELLVSNSNNFVKSVSACSYFTEY